MSFWGWVKKVTKKGLGRAVAAGATLGLSEVARGSVGKAWNDLTGKTQVDKTNSANLQSVQSTNDANVAIANATNQMQRDIAASNIAMQRETNQQNLDIFNQQRQDAIDERAYNSPAAQRARMLAAGLNPASVQSSESGALTSVSAPTMQAPLDDTQLVTPTLQAPRFDYTNQKSDIGTFLDLAAKAVDIYNVGQNALKSGKELEGLVIDNSFKKEWNKHQINRAVMDLKNLDVDIRQKKALAFAQELANTDYIEMKNVRQDGLRLANDMSRQSIAVMKEDENYKRLQGDYQSLVNSWYPAMRELEIEAFNASVRQFTQTLALQWANHDLDEQKFKEAASQFQKQFAQSNTRMYADMVQMAKQNGFTEQQIKNDVTRIKNQNQQFLTGLIMNSAMTFLGMQQHAATQLATMMIK